MFNISMHSLSMQDTDDVTVSVLMYPWSGTLITLVIVFFIVGLLRWLIDKDKINIALEVFFISFLAVILVDGIDDYNFNSPHASTTLRYSNIHVEIKDIPGFEEWTDDNYAFNFDDCHAETYQRGWRSGRWVPTELVMRKDSQGYTYSLEITGEKTKRHNMEVYGGTLYECTIHWRVWDNTDSL